MVSCRIIFYMEAQHIYLGLKTGETLALTLHSLDDTRHLNFTSYATERKFAVGQL